MAGKIANDVDALTVRALLRIAAIGVRRTTVGLGDARVGAVIPCGTRRTLRRNTFAVYGFVSRFARRTSRRRTGRTGRIQFGTRRTAVPVFVISVAAGGADIASVAVLRTGRAVLRSAFARRFAVVSAGDFASALARGNLSRRTGGAGRPRTARRANRVQRSAVLTFIARAAIRIGRTFGLDTFARAVRQIARGAVALFARADRFARRIGRPRILTFVTRGTFLGRRTRGYRASAVAVGQLTFGTSAGRVFRAGDTFGRRSRGIFALLTRAAIRIGRTFKNRTPPLTVGQSSRRARIFTAAVVAGFTAFAHAQNGIPLLTRRTAFRSPAHTAARAVGNRIAGAVAFLSFFIGLARAIRSAVPLSVRATGRSRAVASALAVGNLRAGASALFTGSAFHARAVRTALHARGARRFRTFANGFVVFRRTVGRRPRAGGVSANLHTPFLFAFLA